VSAAKHKFRPGRTLKTLNQVWEANLRRQWLYLHARPKHPSVLVNMSMVTIAGFLRAGSIKVAVENKP